MEKDPHAHHVRRTVWDKALNAKGRLQFSKWKSSTDGVIACSEFAPRMDRLCNLLVKRLTEYNGQPVVVNDWIHFATFDIMGDLGFGRSFGQLERGKVHPAISMIAMFVKFTMQVGLFPWLIGCLVRVPGLMAPPEALGRFCALSLEQRKLVGLKPMICTVPDDLTQYSCKETPEDPDVMSHILSSKDGQGRLRDHDLVSDVLLLQV